MARTRRSKVAGWGLVLAVTGSLSAAVALASSGHGGARTSGKPTHCSPTAPRGMAPERWPAARQTLAPAGASAIRLCRYSGLNAHPRLTLVRARLLDRAGLVTQLVKRFDGLPLAPRGAVSCPADDGSEIVALVSYPGGREVSISVGLRGCLQVTNGSVNRTASGYGPHPGRGPRLLAELKRLVDGGHSAHDQGHRPGHWSVLARSPLGRRAEPSVVWDGHELLELGGGTVAGHRNVSMNAGAAFNPKTERWHRVAPAPGEVHPGGNAAVWTGRAAFVYHNPAVWDVAGGVAGLYNPATNRWRVTGGVPVGPFNDATAVWTGHRVILAGITSSNRPGLEVAGYAPATDQWMRMHPGIPRRHPPVAMAMVETNEGVLLWSLWSRTHQISRNSYTVYSGVDVFRLTPTGRWIKVTGHWPQHQTVDDPVFTGRKVLLAPGQIWCGVCSHPGPVDEHGFIVDPRTLHMREIPHGPLDDLGPQILWTGHSELSLNPRGEISGPHAHVYPGDIATWYPRARKWIRGPRAPKSIGDAPALWTGKRLLVLAQDGHLLAYRP
jgi:hypothetical protein